MGVNTRKPPLPAPTDISSADNTSAVADDLATDISRRTDKTSYSVPEDGSPVTISTKKLAKEIPTTAGQQSQTSLLIEYFEGARSAGGEKVHSRPSVRVRVTPSSAKRHRRGQDDAERANEHIQITETAGRDRKPSYTRRISLGKKQPAQPAEGAETTISDGSSQLDRRPPVEVEVLQQYSDVSRSDVSRDRFVPLPSDISSMPPDSVLEPSLPQQQQDVQQSPRRRRSRSLERLTEEVVTTEKDTLKAPQGSRSRSLSRERITQKVMEKLAAENLTSPTGVTSGGKHKSPRGVSKESFEGVRSPRRRHKSHKEDDFISGTESSVITSQLDPKRGSGDQHSIRSGGSVASSINNPRLLQTVEDAIRRLILPELTALKEEQNVQRKMSKYGRSADDTSPSDGLQRRVSKHASAPDVSAASKPKVVLNRDGADPGVTLSHGDSVKHRKVRRSSRDSVTERTHGGSRRSSAATSQADDSERVRKKKSRSSDHRARDVAIAGAVGAGLTAAALRHHDSMSTTDGSHREKRKKRSKSKSRSVSRSERHSEREEVVEVIPPLPMQSELHSDLTRESILSVDTERPSPRDSREITTPVREVRRGSSREVVTPTAASPASRTPTRTPVRKGLASPRSDRERSNGAISSPKSERSSKSRHAALAAAAGAAGAAALAHKSPSHEYGDRTPTRNVSPVQSDVSYRGGPMHVTDEYEEERMVSPVSAAREGHRSNVSMASISSVRSADLARSTRPAGINLESPEEILGDEILGDNPDAAEVDEWLDKEHERNEQYRSELSQRDSSTVDYKRMTNFTDDSHRDSTAEYKRMTNYTDDSFDASYLDRVAAASGDVKGVGLNPEFVHTPFAVESAMASLHDPSSIVSGGSSQSGHLRAPPPERSNANSASGERNLALESEQQHLQPRPNALEGDTLVPGEDTPISDYWNAVRGQAQKAKQERLQNQRVDVVTDPASPPQSEARSARSSEGIEMTANAIPGAPDEMPAIGHFDDRSDVTTNPSVIQGPLDPNQNYYNDSPRSDQRSFGQRSFDQRSYDQRSYGRDSMDDQSARDRDSVGAFEAATLGAGVAATAIAAKNAVHTQREKQQAYVEDEEEREHSVQEDYSPVRETYANRAGMAPSPANLKDEGYMSSAHVRSPGGYTPEPLSKQPYNQVPKLFDERDLEDFDIAPGTGRPPPLNDYGNGDMDDPFGAPSPGAKHVRHLSGNSHGMASPLYDSATGKGLDRIQSKDVVALMDHLTVRDAQRNARDTEILITLVRSAAEMRNSFEDMKRFIAEQDRLLATQADKNTDRVLRGPRPQPLGSPRTPRQAPPPPTTRTRSSDDATTDDLPTRRRNVFRRALKGLGNRGSNDLGKIETMLVQLLGEVEGLKDAQPFQPLSETFPPSASTAHGPTGGSYDNLRSASSAAPAVPLPLPSLGLPGVSAGTDPGYEPEGQAGTSSSTPNNHSGGNLSLQSGNGNGRYLARHSGYDGRRGSEHRISTVLEGDEDEFGTMGDGALTPTQEATNAAARRGSYDRPQQQQQSSRYEDEYIPSGGSGGQTGVSGGREGRQNSLENTPRTDKARSRHKSTNSSLFGIPKISRWSRTTASSAEPGRRSGYASGPITSPQDDYEPEEDVDITPERRGSEGRRLYYSDEASRSGSQVAYYSEDRPYELQEEDRFRSQGSLVSEQQQRHYRDGPPARSPSPLIPSEVGASDLGSPSPQPHQQPQQRYQQQQYRRGPPEPASWIADDDFDDDPKYQAHRNSLNLQHPQPRPGPTGRHQNHLESAAHALGHSAWGPYEGEDDGSSVRSSGVGAGYDQWGSNPSLVLGKGRGGQGEGVGAEGPLVPPKVTVASNGAGGGGEARRGEYASPRQSGGSGGFLAAPPLAPIEEVRYSLETDRQHLTPSPSIQPSAAQRKVTGPRPMGSRSSSNRSTTSQQGQPQANHQNHTDGQAMMGTVRRKPISGGSARSWESYDSFESETF